MFIAGEPIGRSLHAARDLVARQALDAQAEAQVLRHRHLRIERVVLEHHRHDAGHSIREWWKATLLAGSCTSFRNHRPWLRCQPVACRT